LLEDDYTEEQVEQELAPLAIQLAYVAAASGQHRSAVNQLKVKPIFFENYRHSVSNHRLCLVWQSNLNRARKRPAYGAPSFVAVPLILHCSEMCNAVSVCSC
jgi:hypothetical protein